MTALPTSQGQDVPGSRRARLLAALRIIAGLLLVVGIAGQYRVSLAYWQRIRLHDLGLRTADFLSAFTHEANLACGALLVLGGLLLLRGSGATSRWYTVLRLAFLPAILIAGIVYNLLLRSAPVPPGSQLDWANEVMHVVAPTLVLLDWLVAPRRRRLPFRTAWWALAFPIGWLVYTFVRAPLVPDEIKGTPYYYPYGFLDPHAAGWAPVLVLVGVLTLVVLLLGVLAVGAWRLEDLVAARRAGRVVVEPASEEPAASTPAAGRRPRPADRSG
ncbi:Pr6Pr family membrane protein [Amnibacterium sp. CER49]|uniref:Pr6Pr family membrane protein n=1 Tax=Amnibacterium sp. CER49 TaxID=3039161 RepID=UPI00244BA875|nr:Pr6Pr family membrane protein [Amnibacterium sp. CER49]MDH2442369.1 Pr6Pr family membrane protein [Amnibacterium sp. CER49]